MDVQGHRGSRGTAPENSLPGFLEAIEAGVDALELDLMATKDGFIVIHHNFLLNTELCQRLDGQPIADTPFIHEMTLAELKELDCGTKPNPRFPRQVPVPGTFIPTLQELLELIESSSSPYAMHVQLNLEIKRDPAHPEVTMEPVAFARKLVALIEAKGFSERVYYSSFDPESLNAVAYVNPLAKLAFLFELPLENGFYDFDILSPHLSLLTPELIKSHPRIVTWTVNDPTDWAKLIDLGVDGIITDYPKDLIQFLKKRKKWVLNTSHEGKRAEFVRLFEQHGATLITTEIDFAEMQSDPVCVVMEKARLAGEGILVEDTSLEVDGYDIGINVRFKLDQLSRCIGKQAKIRTLLAYHEKEKCFVYEGIVDGEIVAPKGRGGFGFDSQFLPRGANQTLAESKPDSVNARAKAVESLFNSIPLRISRTIND